MLKHNPNNFHINELPTIANCKVMNLSVLNFVWGEKDRIDVMEGNSTSKPFSRESFVLPMFQEVKS